MIFDKVLYFDETETIIIVCNIEAKSPSLQQDLKIT